LTKEKDECYGCSRPWKGNSLFCPMCEEKGIASSGGGLIESVAKFKPGTQISNEKYNEACIICKAPNTVVFGICAECTHKMSYNSVLGVYTGI